METRKEEQEALKKAVDHIEEAWNTLDYTKWYLDVAVKVSSIVAALAKCRDLLNEQKTIVESDVQEEVFEEAKKDSKILPFPTHPKRAQ